MIRNGIDIVKIEKVKNMLDKSHTFVDMLLTKEEQKYYESKKTKVERAGVLPKQAQTLAGFFACKEAVLKAFGIGVLNGVDFKEVEINHTASGEPIVNFYGKMKDMFTTLAVKSCAVSISHDGEYAVAICTLEI